MTMKDNFRFQILYVLIVLIQLCQSVPFSLRGLQSVVDEFKQDKHVSKSHDPDGECRVVGYNAGCCQHIELDQVDLNSTVCVNLTYLPNDYGVSFTLTLDKKTFINETVSARNPPALCAELPYTKELASICLKLVNLDISNSSFSGCVKVIVDLAYVSIADVELGCFKIPLQVKQISVGENPWLTTNNHQQAPRSRLSQKWRSSESSIKKLIQRLNSKGNIH